MSALEWPYEGARPLSPNGGRLAQAGSNVCLDLHGDPRAARLVVFSDGNHHMALEEALQAFLAGHPPVSDIFYATTPPRVIAEALKAGSVRVGNLAIAVTPHVFISPAQVLDRLVADGHMRSHRPFARSRGSALLVRKGNPKGVHGIADLERRDVRVFLSNPVTETVSYETYAETLRKVAARERIRLDFLESGSKSERVVHGESIHHREAPQCVADGKADVAVVFHHLALRYVRIFPDVFEMLPLGRGAGSDPDHVTNTVHIGLVGNGGEWGAPLVEFMLGPRVAEIYGMHGLFAVSS